MIQWLRKACIRFWLWLWTGITLPDQADEAIKELPQYWKEFGNRKYEPEPDSPF